MIPGGMSDQAIPEELGDYETERASDYLDGGTAMSEGTYVHFVDPPPIPHGCKPPLVHLSGRESIWQCNCGQRWLHDWTITPLKKKVFEVWVKVQSAKASDNPVEVQP